MHMMALLQDTWESRWTRFTRFSLLYPAFWIGSILTGRFPVSCPPAVSRSLVRGQGGEEQGWEGQLFWSRSPGLFLPVVYWPTDWCLAFICAGECLTRSAWDAAQASGKSREIRPDTLCFIALCVCVWQGISDCSRVCVCVCVCVFDRTAIVTVVIWQE